MISNSSKIQENAKNPKKVMFFKKKHDSLYDLGHMNMILTEFPINAIICDKFHVASCYGILEINGHSILTVFRK